MSEITKPVMLNETGQDIVAGLNRVVSSLQDIADSQKRKAEESVHYGIKIAKNDSNPATRMEYMYDCVNFVPAHMDYTNGKFDYGSWGDAFFVRNNYPAMVTFEGIEDYKLDPNDQTKKLNGTTSDVSNLNYNGNAMSVFNCKIWLYLHEDSDYEYIEVSNVKLNNNFYDYGYDRGDGTHADKLYYPMFAGHKDENGKLRSIADVVPWYFTGGAEYEIAAASANGSNWQIMDYAHKIVLNSLLWLMCLHDDTQVAYGNGNAANYIDDNSQNYGHLNTGTLKDKGQFFGYNDWNHQVKVFFIEKWWGDMWERCLGLINIYGTLKYKLTPPYNTTGEGYFSIPDYVLPLTTGYQKYTTCGFFGRITKTTGDDASDTTYTTDLFICNNTNINMALYCGDNGNGAGAGALVISLGNSFDNSWTTFGASVYLIQPR